MKAKNPNGGFIKKKCASLLLYIAQEECKTFLTVGFVAGLLTSFARQRRARIVISFLFLFTRLLFSRCTNCIKLRDHVVAGL